MIKSKKKIILASASPRRTELMKKLGLDFTVQPSDYEEDMKKKLPPKELAKFLSLGKARAVALNQPNSIVIGADTFVACGKKLLGKPGTPAMAKKMLKFISGRTVSVFTGLTLIDTGSNKIISRSVETKIYIKKLNQREIINYVKSGEPLDKAGAFAIQGLGAVFIDKIEGDYLSTVGLPLRLLADELKELGINIL